jgi:hypothetical protein
MIGPLALRSQSPIVRAQDAHAITLAVDAQPSIRPLGIFVARRQSFEVQAERHIGALRILKWAFVYLPLFEHGWRESETRVTLIRDGAPHAFWKLERAQ